MRPPRVRIAAIGFVLLAVAAVRVEAQVQVDFVPASLNLSLGQRAYVAVNVSGIPAAGLAAYQLEIIFDPLPIDLLNPNEAFRGTIAPFAPLGNNAACTTVRGTPSCADPNWMLISSGRTSFGTDSIDNTTGRVLVGFGSFGAPLPPQGSGTIAYLEVFGAYNGTSTLSFAELILADDAEPPVAYAATPDSLTVVVGSGIANVPPLLSAIGNRSSFERVPFGIPLAATDADGNDLTLSATGLPGFCSLNDRGDGTGSVSCTPQVGNAGTYPLVFSVTDDGAPNLRDSEAISVTVLPTNCTDVDLDGYGAPGDLSCPGGTSTDCNDTLAAVSPGVPERCRNAIDDDCNGQTDAQESQCAGTVCVTVSLGTPASDPALAVTKAANCPTPVLLPRSIDLVWGDAADLRFVANEVKLGTVTQVMCADLNSTRLFDNLRPDPGQLDFFLARESGQPTYGTSSTAKPRTPDSGDCP